MRRALAALLLRELRLAVRLGGGAMTAAVFFLALVATIPLAVGPDPALLARIGPALLWLGALLACLLGLDRMFQADREDGSLDAMMLADVPASLMVLVKALAHWATTGLPLALIAPLLGLMLNVEPAALGAVAATLVAGTPALTLVGSVGAALTAGLRRGGLLAAIVVLPLTIPVLIFGVGATRGAIDGTVALAPPLTALVALTLASLVLAPVAAAAALRLALE